MKPRRLGRETTMQILAHRRVSELGGCSLSSLVAAGLAQGALELVERGVLVRAGNRIELPHRPPNDAPPVGEP